MSDVAQPRYSSTATRLRASQSGRRLTGHASHCGCLLCVLGTWTAGQRSISSDDACQLLRVLYANWAQPPHTVVKAIVERVMRPGRSASSSGRRP